MQVVLLQILLWILRIILFLLLLIFALIVIIMIIPIQYRVEGELHDKKPGIRGKVTWFFYLINMKFAYEEEFHMVVRVFGFKVYDSGQELSCEQEQSMKDTVIVEKIEGIKIKIQDIVQKLKDILKKIQEGKLKAEHYLELWNRKETQVTFQRAKKKLVKVIKAVLPRKWNVNGEIGFEDPATTGKIMGAFGAMYPIVGNRVQMIPDFENEVLEVEGKVKGHVRLGNLMYQLVSLLLNRHCFKFIKLVFDELGGSKKKKQ